MLHIKIAIVLNFADILGKLWAVSPSGGYVLSFKDIQSIHAGVLAQDAAEAQMAAALRALHPDNYAPFMLHTGLRAAFDLALTRAFGSEDAFLWWEWWLYERPVGSAQAWNVEINNVRYAVTTIEDLFAVLVLTGRIEADPEFTHVLQPVS
jgi:hypothetical protein